MRSTAHCLVCICETSWPLPFLVIYGSWKSHVLCSLSVSIRCGGYNRQFLRKLSISWNMTGQSCHVAGNLLAFNAILTFLFLLWATMLSFRRFEAMMCDVHSWNLTSVVDLDSEENLTTVRLNNDKPSLRSIMTKAEHTSADWGRSDIPMRCRHLIKSTQNEWNTTPTPTVLTNNTTSEPDQFRSYSFNANIWYRSVTTLNRYSQPQIVEFLHHKVTHRHVTYSTCLCSTKMSQAHQTPLSSIKMYLI